MEIVADKVKEWCASQSFKKFDRKTWISHGYYSLRLYLQDNVPPNILHLSLPKPSGPNPISIPTIDQEIHIDMDLRHFNHMIDKEIEKIKSNELARFPNLHSQIVDVDALDEDNQYWRAKTILIKIALHLANNLLKKLLLFDWSKNTDYENRPTIFTDEASKSQKWAIRSGLVKGPHDKDLPGVLDLLSSPVTHWVKAKGAGDTYKRIQDRVNNISNILTNLGFEHPPPFGLISIDIFKRFILPLFHVVICLFQYSHV